jgi:hypothetical protein
VVENAETNDQVEGLVGEFESPGGIRLMVFDSLATNLTNRKFPGRLNDSDSLKPVQYRQQFITVGTAEP